MDGATLERHQSAAMKRRSSVLAGGMVPRLGFGSGFGGGHGMVARGTFGGTNALAIKGGKNVALGIGIGGGAGVVGNAVVKSAIVADGTASAGKGGRTASLHRGSRSKRKRVPPGYENNWRGRLPHPLPFALHQVERVLRSHALTFFIVLLTFTDLFLEDIKIVLFSPSQDRVFGIMSLLVFCVFSMEVMLNSIVTPGYFLSLFFFLDAVSSVSLLPDIPWIWLPLVGLRTGDSGVTDGGQDHDTAFELERITRVSRTEAHLLRVMRFVKLLRLGRVAKLFEVCQRKVEERSRDKKREATRAKFGNDVLESSEYAEPTALGSHLAERTTRKVVALVLSMLIIMPLLQPETSDSSMEFVVQRAHRLASSPALFSNVSAEQDPDTGVWMVLDRPTINSTDFDTHTLLPWLDDYSSSRGQPLPSGDKHAVQSPPLNQSYVASLTDPDLVPLTIAALQGAIVQMDAEMHWLTNFYNKTLLYARVRGQWYANDYLVPDLFDHRPAEMVAFALPSFDHERFPERNSLGVFSVRDNVRQEATMGLTRTAVVLALLTIASVAFNLHNHIHVILPSERKQKTAKQRTYFLLIERMMTTIVALQRNPLARAQLSGIEREGASAKKDAKDSHPSLGAGSTPSSVLPERMNETTMLEKTLEKLTGLLQVGFGAAGSRMIAKAMNLTSEGELDPLVAGAEVLGIFGFCDIRRFTDATECLREEVMLYVNEIASIVHTNVVACDGAPNKNIGDAFLLVWRLPDEHMDADDLFQLTERGQPQAAWSRAVGTAQTLGRRRAIAAMASREDRENAREEDQRAAEAAVLQRARKAGASVPRVLRALHPSVQQHVSVLADKALVSFLRAHVALAASAAVAQFAAHPRIQAAFDHFVVQLGFGLHAGWAVEGPIGSRFKIDASYLSPHVNLSETLQDATKLYGTPILMSGEFTALLSPYVRSFCRRMDVVRVAGREAPVNLYGFDIHAASLRSILDGDTPPGYDLGADIRVVECKGRKVVLGQGAAALMMDDPSPSQRQTQQQQYGSALTARGRNLARVEPFPLPAPVAVNPALRTAAAAADVHDLRELLQNPWLRATGPPRGGGGTGGVGGRGGILGANGADGSSDDDDDDEESSNNSSSSSSSSSSKSKSNPNSKSAPNSANADEKRPLRVKPLVLSDAAAPSAAAAAKKDAKRRSSSIPLAPEVVEAQLQASAVLRAQTQSSSPIASYHLVHNYRLSALQGGIPHVFFATYARALDLYLAGDWAQAEPALRRALELYPEDTPTQLLLDRIVKTHKRIPPDNWTGCTEI